MKNSRVVVTFKGGKGSGFHGHSGRPGMVGGSAPKVAFSVGTLRPRAFDRNPNLRPPTEQEFEVFYSMANSLPKEIQQLRPKSGENIALVVEKDGAQAYGTTIYIDELHLKGYGQNYGMVLEHEYIHTMVAGNKKIKNSIERDYRPPFLYKHTDRYGEDVWGKQNEQFTMVMTAFHKDRNIWIANVQRIENYYREYTIEEAESQVSAIETYLRGIRLW